jgi:N-methylhydantoinase A
MIAKRPKLSFPCLSEVGRAVPSQAVPSREVHLRDTRNPLPCPVYQRSELAATSRIVGPALIQEHGTTTVMFEDDVCTVAPSGELTIAVAGAQ